MNFLLNYKILIILIYSFVVLIISLNIKYQEREIWENPFMYYNLDFIT